MFSTDSEGEQGAQKTADIRVPEHSVAFEFLGLVRLPILLDIEEKVLEAK